MLPLSLLEFIDPLPGQILLHREDSPGLSPSGLVLIPETYSKRVKSGIAIVKKVGYGVPPFIRPGERVLVAAGVGRHIPLGDDMGREQQRLYVANAFEILGRIETETATRDLGEDARGRFRNPGPLYDQAQDDLADEGETRGHKRRSTA